MTNERVIHATMEALTARMLDAELRAKNLEDDIKRLEVSEKDMAERASYWRARALKAEAESERLRVSLSSIARNTCCDRCQEAAKVARAAIKG